MAGLKFVTWNINSIRLRHPNVAAFTAEQHPDILCLQEIKCRTEEFPVKAFHKMGYEHLHVTGQGGGHHGVAIASRHPLTVLDPPSLCQNKHARVQTVRVDGIELHNIYLPAGGDIPDPVTNPKFAHKLDFLARMKTAYTDLAKTAPSAPRMVVGDLNTAPHPNDVWSHKQLLKIVSHTPVETEALETARGAGGFDDIARLAYPDDQKLYTWWSYRARDWAASNRGRRLDHIWANKALTPRVDLTSFRVHLAWRGGWKPSDHAPVSVIIN